MLGKPKDKVEKLEKILDEAKRIKQAYEEQNGKSSTRIANKDILFWLVTKHFEQDVKVEKLSTRVSILQVFFCGTIISVILLLVGIIMG